MGYGEFGGGGSVDWVVDNENVNTEVRTEKGKAYSRDPIPLSDLGVKKGAPAGHFKIEVLFNTAADAFAAQQSVAVHGATLVLYVKANTAEARRYPAQVRVSW